MTQPENTANLAVRFSVENGLTTEAPTKISEELYNSYIEAKYKEEDIPLMELAAIRINQLQQRTAEAVISIGRHLNGVKDTMQWGSWQFWVEQRANLSEDTAQRFMAAARVVERFPDLLLYTDSINATAFQLLGQNKSVDESVVAEVITLADTGSVTVDDVRDVIKNKKERDGSDKPAAAPKPVGVEIDEVNAEKVLEFITVNSAQLVTNYMFAGMTNKQIEQVGKHSKFKAFQKHIMDNATKPGSAETDIEKALANLIFVAFVAHESYYNPQPEADQAPFDQMESAAKSTKSPKQSRKDGGNVS